MIWPIPPRIAAGVAIVAALGAAFYFYGRSEFKRGVRETVAEFHAADQQGAQTINETAEETLRRIGDDPDLESLLDSTNGFRD